MRMMSNIPQLPPVATVFLLFLWSRTNHTRAAGFQQWRLGSASSPSAGPRLKSLSMPQGMAEQMGFFNASETSIFSSWRRCTLVSGPPELPLEETQTNTSHTYTHSLPSQTHTPFSREEKKKFYKWANELCCLISAFQNQNWSTVCE